VPRAMPASKAMAIYCGGRALTGGLGGANGTPPKLGGCVGTFLPWRASRILPITSFHCALVGFSGGRRQALSNSIGYSCLRSSSSALCQIVVWHEILRAHGDRKGANAILRNRKRIQ